MAKLPEPPPPDPLRAVSPEVYTLPAGELLWRIYARAGRHPRAWNEFRTAGPRPDARFDHHTGAGDGSRAILYAARHVLTCIAEYFQETRTIDRDRDQPALAGFRVVKDLKLLSLRDAWPTRAGASMAISTTGRRARTRDWSRAIYAAYPGLQGILYCSSMDANQEAFALYERAHASLATNPEFNRLLSDPDLEPILVQAALRFGYSFAYSLP